MLPQLLAQAEAAALQSGFVTQGGSHQLLAEMVLWVMHEEWLGPAPLSPEQQMVRDTILQLAPQLPRYLRGKPFRSVELTSPDQLRIWVDGAEPPDPGEEFSFNLGLALELDGHHWVTKSVDFEIGSGATLVFRRADSRRERRDVPATLTITNHG
jgi:hypothetical protein